jgi:DNA polymerase-4
MILHVDMDAFFASVEVLDNPGLAGKCVIVGGVSNRGVVSAASYEARRYGVHSAMPMFQARQKCPHGIFLKPRGSRYKALSRRIMAILKEFSPVIEPVSIDEAYMDITGCATLYGPPEKMGSSLKKKILAETGLTCTVGIAPLKFLAKIASDMEKPDGLTFIAPGQVPEFISRLPVEKVPGVGRRTRKQLERLGIETLGDARKYSTEQLIRRLGKYGGRLAELAAGVDTSQVTPVRPVKSISSEETLAADTRDRGRLRNVLLAHAEDVGRQLRKKGLRAGCVTIKIKHADFTQHTRQSGLSRPTRSSDTLYRSACRLLSEYTSGKPVRLIGLGAADLHEEASPVQMDLFRGPEASEDEWESVDHAVDAISERFGDYAVRRAGLFDSSGDSS